MYMEMEDGPIKLVGRISRSRCELVREESPSIPEPAESDTVRPDIPSRADRGPRYTDSEKGSTL